MGEVVEVEAVVDGDEVVLVEVVVGNAIRDEEAADVVDEVEVDKEVVGEVVGEVVADEAVVGGIVGDEIVVDGVEVVDVVVDEVEGVDEVVDRAVADEEAVDEVVVDEVPDEGVVDELVDKVSEDVVEMAKVEDVDERRELVELWIDKLLNDAFATCLCSNTRGLSWGLPSTITTTQDITSTPNARTAPFCGVHCRKPIFHFFLNVTRQKKLPNKKKPENSTQNDFQTKKITLSELEDSTGLLSCSPIQRSSHKQTKAKDP
jgi:hypothetical protein